MRILEERIKGSKGSKEKRKGLRRRREEVGRRGLGERKRGEDWGKGREERIVGKEGNDERGEGYKGSVRGVQPLILCSGYFTPPLVSRG